MDRRLVEMTRTVAVIVDVSWRSTSVITMKHPNWWGDVVETVQRSLDLVQRP